MKRVLTPLASPLSPFGNQLTLRYTMQFWIMTEPTERPNWQTNTMRKSLIRNILRVPKRTWSIAPNPATMTRPLRSASQPMGMDRMMNASGCEAVRSTTLGSPAASPKTGVTSFRIRENVSHIIWPTMKMRPKTRSTAQR